MPDYLKEARKAEKQKTFSRAGEFYRLAGDFDSAVEMYMKAEDFILAAGLMEQKGNWSAAANLYERGRQYRDAAKIYERIKDYKSAFSMYEKIADYPRASEMAEKAGDYFKAAVMAEEAKTLQRAAKLYIQASQFPQAARIYYKLLQQLIEVTDKKFIADYDAQLTKHANATGMLYEKIQDFQKAAYCYQLAKNHKKAAESYLADQKPEKAAEIYHQIKNYNKAFEILSGTTEVSNKALFADVCFQLKKFDKASTLFQQSGNLSRAADACEQAHLYKIAADLYEELGNFKRAAEMCLKANNKVRAAELYEKAGNFNNSAILYQQSGQTEKAIECYLAIGKRIPAAKIALSIKDEDKAISLLQAVNPMEDEYKDASGLLGVLFAQRGMNAAAQRKFEEALDRPILTKANLEIYHEVAIQQEKMGMRAEAADLYERILSVDFTHKDASRRLEDLRRSAVYHIPDAYYAPPTVVENQENIPAPKQSRLVASRYELVEEITHDASGKVYKASDQFFQRPVMIRILPKQDQNLTQEILRCTQISSSLNHSNILAIYDGGKDEDDYFVCTEYVDGVTLRQYLSDRVLNIQEIIQIARQIIYALTYVHKKGLIHGNLTPENIYIAGDKSIKVTNFGNLAAWEKQNASVVKQYLSPEQLMEQVSDERSDLYSFGIILYELIYGDPPFSGFDVEQQHLRALPIFEESPLHTIPDFLIKVMKKCLAKDRNRRYANAEEILPEFETTAVVPGQVINGRYEILHEIGEGGMGHVYEARDRDLDEIVALKMLKGEISGDPEVLQRFIREIKVARMIAHPNVVRVFDTATYETNRYITMEYIDGIGLDRWIEESKNADLRTRVGILLKILQGVQAAHGRGIVHRDLKPQNILIDAQLNPHILDFGISRLRTSGDRTTARLFLGSPKYTSPEQINGQDADYRSDIYSLGVICFYMLTFQEPFAGDDVQAILMKHLTQEPPTLRQLNPEIPLWLEDIVLRALRKEPARRFENIEEMLGDLKFGLDFKQ